MRAPRCSPVRRASCRIASTFGHGRGGRRDRGGGAESGGAGRVVPVGLRDQQSGQCLDAPRRRRRPSATAVLQAPLPWRRACRQGGAAADPLRQLLLCRRGQSTDRRARAADHLRGRQCGDPRQRVRGRARARSRPAEDAGDSGPRAVPPPRRTRGGPAPHVFIDGAEVADVYRHFADACSPASRR